MAKEEKGITEPQFVDFLIHYNFIQLALGTVLGMAFNQIVLSFVDDLLFPLIGRWFKIKNLADLVWANMEVGKFLINFIYFIIVIGSISLVFMLIFFPYLKQSVQEAKKEDHQDDQIREQVLHQLKFQNSRFEQK